MRYYVITEIMIIRLLLLMNSFENSWAHQGIVKGTYKDALKLMFFNTFKIIMIFTLSIIVMGIYSQDSLKVVLTSIIFKIRIYKNKLYK